MPRPLPFLASLLLPLLLVACGGGGSSGGDNLPGEDPGQGGEMTQDELAWALEVLDRTNTERGIANLGALAWDAEAAAVAQAHNRDMRARGFFAHRNPSGQEPDDRLRAAGVVFNGWGENIARRQATPSAVMDSWMDSPDHRDNILGAFTDVGIGVLLVTGGPWWTQAFVSR